ncbi:TetR/AcrR family transcriptional regulator [Pseudacidobacterium ailaaui]|uniref:TetR/AcrR family transcriptional regulator n=1 Tax=Pseudacidobacterium ailaaui TaxID=1382359 RepID=UPI0009DE4D85
MLCWDRMVRAASSYTTDRNCPGRDSAWCCAERETKRHICAASRAQPGEPEAIWNTASCETKRVRRVETDMSKGAETRKRIIAKAAPLFNRKGYEGCSMQDIVEAVGLEKGSLYGHFATKEELAVAAFEHAWSETSKARMAGMDTATDAIAKLRVHLENVVSLPAFPGGCPLLNTITDSDDGNAALKKAAKEALKQWRMLIEGTLEEGQRRKEVKPEIVPKEVAAVMISLLEGAMALDRLDKKAGCLQTAGRHLQLYLNSISIKRC